MLFIAVNNAKIMINPIINLDALTKHSQMSKKNSYNLMKTLEKVLLASEILEILASWTLDCNACRILSHWLNIS